MKYKIVKTPIMEKVAEMHESVKMVSEAIEVINNWVADITHCTWVIYNLEELGFMPVELKDSTFNVDVVEGLHDNCYITISKIAGYEYSVEEVSSRRNRK